MKTNKTITSLENKINEARTAYYNGTEIISDDEFDALVYELSTLDPSNQLLLKVGADPSTEWKKEKHLYPLGSLNKVNFPNEMDKWVSENLQNKETVVIEKLDGLSIGCQYEDGNLVKACLRGNGLEGEDILQNVLKMHGAKKSLSNNFSGLIRGEIILTKTNHQMHFNTYSNPRNAASGLCRKLDGEGSEHLTLMMYDVMSENVFSFEKEKLQWLIDNGFIVPNFYVCKTSNEINDLWKHYQDNIRTSLDYEIDGLVVVCNDCKTQSSLGEINLRPKGKMAYKFANQFVKTVVKNITWTVGNSGRVTPIGWVEPVDILGSRVEKASLYNVAYIENLGLDIGAEVLLCKANEIIPRIEKVVKSTNSIAKAPDLCPSCNASLEIVGEYLRCPNSLLCKEQISGRIKNWIKELNILEWGAGLIEKLTESGKVVIVSDLYKLSINDLESIDRMGEKSAKKCYDLLWANKEIPLEVFLGGLSIPMIGQSTIKAIMQSGCNSLDEFFLSSAQDFENVLSVGPSKAKSLEQGLIENEDLINELLSLGLVIKEKIDGVLSGTKIAVTGSTNIKRSELEKFITNNGGIYKNTISRDCTHLIIADVNSTSAKANDARKNNIKLISEEDFLNMLKR